jgi:hypothetical protein
MKPILRADGAGWLAVTAMLALGAILVALIGLEHGGLAVGTAWSAAIDWRPGPPLDQPWRLWTAAWVHWSTAHLGVNLVGAAVVGAVGWRARAPRAAAIAWFLAWPLTALSMTLSNAHGAPTLLHYGGLSGVLHAGVAVLGLTLAWPQLLVRRPIATPLQQRDTGFATTRASRITEGPWAMTTLEELSSAPAATPASTLDAPRLVPVPLTAAQAARHRWIGIGILAGTLAKVASEAPWGPALRPSALLGIEVVPMAHACGIAAGLIAWLALGICVRATRPRRPDQD